jgi:hypothetical protein
MMAELPQPTELPREPFSVVGLLAIKVRDILSELRKGILRILGQVRQDLAPDFLGWLSIVLLVPVSIYAAAELGLNSMEIPSTLVISRLEANYGEWTLAEIRRVRPEIVDEIRKDRPDEGIVIGSSVQESGFVGIHFSTQEPEREGSHSGSSISPAPTPTGVDITPSTTTTESPTPDVTPTHTFTPTPDTMPTLIYTPTVGPTFTPMATDTPPPTPTPHPTNTPVPTNPPPTETSNVTICHKPGQLQRTLNVPQSNVADHLAHGDYLGACNES